MSLRCDRRLRHGNPQRAAAESTIARPLAAMASFYHHLVDRGVLDRNPAERMRAVRRDAAHPTPTLREADCAALVHAAAADSPAADVLVCLGYLNGLRASEVVAAPTTALVASAGEATLQLRAKGGATRTVPLSQRAARACHRAAAVGGQWLMVDTAGKPFSRQRPAGLLARLATRAGIGLADDCDPTSRAVTPHILRASAATHLFDAGVAGVTVGDAGDAGAVAVVAVAGLHRGGGAHGVEAGDLHGRAGAGDGAVAELAFGVAAPRPGGFVAEGGARLCT